MVKSTINERKKYKFWLKKVFQCISLLYFQNKRSSPPVLFQSLQKSFQLPTLQNPRQKSCYQSYIFWSLLSFLFPIIFFLFILGGELCFDKSFFLNTFDFYLIFMVITLLIDIFFFKFYNKLLIWPYFVRFHFIIFMFYW